MYKKIITTALILLVALGINAQEAAKGLNIDLRAGLSVGGAMPLGMPETIRGLEHYGLEFNPQIALDIEKPLTAHWGVMTGLRLDRKAMDITARVKNYHITIVRGGESLSGMFTGYNQTSECQWSITVPLSAAYTIKRVRIFAGPYLSYITGRKFEGSAYDGYLRVDDPTGPKVELGTAPTDRGTYDFAEDMRRIQWGIQAGADWMLTPHWGVYAMAQWGLCGIHKGSFDTISQTLYPIYATAGVIYRLGQK